MAEFKQSTKLHNVLYDIRGPILQAAQQMEAEGHRILKLNIGNPAPFGFEAPDAILVDMIRHLPHAQGYSDSRGIFSARTAVSQYYQTRGIQNIHVDDIYLGNGVSELITMSLMALLDGGDEVLIPTPDYPLWTASVALAGGKPVHYLCDEESGWQPDLEDMEAKITPRTKGIVVINPNNPTGAVYPEETLQENRGAGREARPGALRRRDLREDPLRGRRPREHGQPHRRRCAVPDVQRPVQGLPGVRLPGRLDGHLGSQERRRGLPGGHQPAREHAPVRQCAGAARHPDGARRLPEHQRPDPPGRRLLEQRNKAYDMLNAIPGVSTQQARGAMYLFPKLDPEVFHIRDDEKFVLDLLREQKILVSHGRAFNWVRPDHFRMVTLP